MNTVLKKAGIVVASATACLLAVSPLAFAGDYDGDKDHNGDKDRHHSKGADCDQDNSSEYDGDSDDGSLISISRNSVQVPIQACGNDVLSGVVGVLNFGDQENESNDD